ncbi:MAG: DedA family protein [Deltaproteobacteria bacterium]|nr:DedA family protein [Deltaproteobacteria bacterium]
MLHSLLKTWFHWVEAWGYLGVFLLMALESSIVPIPSEIVMPPAAYWAAQGRMTLWGVILAGTAGSYAGSAISYWVAQWVGLPVVNKFGKYVLIGPDKVEMAKSWVERYGVMGIFLARLLPVVRHLISIPAGILKMRFGSFSAATLTGAFLWCTVLSWFGQKVLGEAPQLLDSPEAMVAAIKAKLLWFVLGAVGFGVLYAVMMWFRNAKPRTA